MATPAAAVTPEDNATKLHKAMTEFTTSQMNRQPIPAHSNVLPKGQFQNSLLQKSLTDLKNQFESMKKDTPAIGADLDKVHAEMQKILTTQYNQLLSSYKFDKTRWDKNFDLTDPNNNSLKTALNNIETATAGKPVHQNISDSIARIQTETINDEMGRIAESVRRQKHSADVKAKAASYGRRFWARIDNPKPDPDYEGGTLTAITTTNFGVGMPGLYHSEGSKFNINIDDKNSAQFRLSEPSWYQHNFNFYDNHKAGIKESMEALAVLGGCKAVTYDFAGLEAKDFGKSNMKQMDRALDAAIELLEQREKTGMGANPRFDFSKHCREIMNFSGYVSQGDKDKILDKIEKYHARYAIQEQKEEQAKTAAAAPPNPAQPAAAATAQPAPATSPLGGFTQVEATGPAAAQAAPSATAAAASPPPSSSQPAASPLGGFAQQAAAPGGAGAAGAGAGEDKKDEEDNRRSGPRPGGPP